MEKVNLLQIREVFPMFPLKLQIDAKSYQSQQFPVKMGSEIQGSRLLRNSSPIHYLWSVQLLEIS